MMRRSRGFTLVELMIALSLAGLLVAGAFQIHAVFNGQARRQQQLTDVQQSLRVSMQIIERAIRGSGAGLLNGKALITPGTGTGTRNLYRVQWYDMNAWPPPVTAGSFQTNAAYADLDPDILRVITAQDVNGYTVTADAGYSATVASIGNTALTWAQYDQILFVNTTTNTTTTAIGCFREIVSPPVTAGANVTIAHGTSGGLLGANNDASCINAIAYPTPIRHFGAQSQTFFRIVPPPATPGTRENPKLAVAIGRIGDPTNAVAWNVISDDVEDMQIALLMGDGRVCNAVDDPTICDPSLASAIRITLVGRTTSSIAGASNQAAGTAQSGGYEDEAAVNATDGRLRRAITSEIILRN